MEDLTNAVLRDRRIFHAGANWFEMMENQRVANVFLLFLEADWSQSSEHCLKRIIVMGGSVSVPNSFSKKHRIGWAGMDGKEHLMNWVCPKVAPGRPYQLKSGMISNTTVILHRNLLEITITNSLTLNYWYSVWVMRGFITSGLLQDSLATESLYRDTLDFLKEGQKIWGNVPRSDRGTVFDDTFVRGIRVLHLEAFTKVRA